MSPHNVAKIVPLHKHGAERLDPPLVPIIQQPPEVRHPFGRVSSLEGHSVNADDLRFRNVQQPSQELLIQPHEGPRFSPPSRMYLYRPALVSPAISPALHPTF